MAVVHCWLPVALLARHVPRLARTPLIRTPASRSEAALTLPEKKRVAPTSLVDRLSDVTNLYVTADKAPSSPCDITCDDDSNDDSPDSEANDNDEAEDEADQQEQPEISTMGTGRKMEAAPSPTLSKKPHKRSRLGGRGSRNSDHVGRSSARCTTRRASGRAKHCHLVRPTGGTSTAFRAVRTTQSCA